jgi:hypothetical protein
MEPFVSVDQFSGAEEGLHAKFRQRYYEKWGSNSAASAPVRFEISPSYMMQRQSAWAMREILGKDADSARLFFILRNPTKRAFSGLFQVAPKSTPEQFASLIQSEIRILDKCYGESFKLPEAPSPTACPSGARQNKDLLACSARYAEASGDSAPWFQRYTRTLGFDWRHANGSAFWRSEGLVIRGLYLDQVRNFVCAGFRPEQMMFIMANELYSNQVEVLARLSAFVGQELGFRTPEDEAEVRKGIFKNHKSRGELDDTSRGILNTFYAKHNRALVQYLLSDSFVVDKEALLREFA